LGRVIFLIISILLLYFFSSTKAPADELIDLLLRVEALNISRYDYTLGKVLTEGQKETAGRNAVKNSSPGTYKFKDGDLYVVAHQITDRVLILYEQFEPASGEKIRELVGSLVFDFGEPTVMAHGKIIYWAFDQKGKLSEKDYIKAKDIKAKLGILGTVKLQSNVKIIGRDHSVSKGRAYYIISSEPVLKLIKPSRKR